MKRFLWGVVWVLLAALCMSVLFAIFGVVVAGAGVLALLALTMP